MASYWNNDYSQDYYPNEHTQLDSSFSLSSSSLSSSSLSSSSLSSSSSSSSFLPFSPSTTAPSLSADHDWFPMTTSSSSISSLPVWPEYTYPIELRRSSDNSSSSKYFKWVRPIARPGRHSSPDDESDIDEDGTDDSFLEVEYPVTTTVTYCGPEYILPFVGSGSYMSEQQHGLRSPKAKYFKWARPGRGGDDSDDDDDEEDTDMECADDDETVMFSGEDEYFSDASSHMSVHPRVTRTRADSFDSNNDDHSMSMMGSGGL